MHALRMPDHQHTKIVGPSRFAATFPPPERFSSAVQTWSGCLSNRFFSRYRNILKHLSEQPVGVENDRSGLKTLDFFPDHPQLKNTAFGHSPSRFVCRSRLSIIGAYVCTFDQVRKSYKVRGVIAIQIFGNLSRITPIGPTNIPQLICNHIRRIKHSGRQYFARSAAMWLANKQNAFGTLRKFLANQPWEQRMPDLRVALLADRIFQQVQIALEKQLKDGPRTVIHPHLTFRNRLVMSSAMITAQ